MIAKLMVGSVVLCILCSCSKDKKEPVQTESMNFKMNGTEYVLDEFKFGAGSPAAGNFRLRSATNYGTTIGVPTDFPYWFDIRKSSSGSICAVLMPKSFPIHILTALVTAIFKYLWRTKTVMFYHQMKSIIMSQERSISQNLIVKMNRILKLHASVRLRQICVI